MIEELRKRKIDEEKKLRDEKRLELEQKKHFRDLEEQKRNLANKEGKNSIFSNDIHGRTIEIKKNVPFPEVYSKCKRQEIVEEELQSGFPEIKKLARSSKHLDPKNKKILAKNEFEELVENSRKQYNKDLEKAVLGSQGIYDKFVPACGVSFTERGKHKASEETVSETKGKINKMDFQSIMSGSSALSSFLPSIKANQSAEISQKSLETKTLHKRSSKFEGISSEMNSEFMEQNNNELSQILISESNQGQYWDSKHYEASILPKAYIPPTYRKIKKLSMGKRAMSTFQIRETEAMNLGVVDMPSIGTRNLDPISIGGRVSQRVPREALGSIKRYPRERKFSQNRYFQFNSKALPPPPIGRTLGHGVL